MSVEHSSPTIIRLPYGNYEEKDFKAALNEAIEDLPVNARVSNSEFDNALLYILGYPTVYIVYSGKENRHSSKNEYTVYVGETNDIRHRTFEHLKIDSRKRDDWRAIAEAVDEDADAFWQYVISHPMFNKSLTLDVENRLMHYLSSTDCVKKLNNRRTNAQGRYYTSDQFDGIFSKIWLGLHRDDPDLFPAEEIIRDSSLFKASPFHQLGASQVDAEEAILARLDALFPASQSGPSYVGNPKLIFVQGAAGTGKTVLLSHLFYRIATEIGIQGDTYSEDEEHSTSNSSRGSELSAYILVNHKEQVHVYNQIALKLGLQKKSNEVVMLPSQFINRFSETNDHGRGIPDKPHGVADIVLIDEAHLLTTQGTQGYSGKNQLYDILRRARVVIAVFDPEQILQARQQWRSSVLRRLFPSNELTDNSVRNAGTISDFDSVELGEEDGLPSISVDVAHIRLEKQFRMAASEGIIQWIDRFAAGEGIGPIPRDQGERSPDGTLIRQPYEIRVFDSPVELCRAIESKAQLPAGGWNGSGLSRVLATYDWKYSSTKNDDDPQGLWNVAMHCDSAGHWQMGLAENDNEGYIPGNTDSRRFCRPWNYQLTDSAPKSIDKDLAWAEKPYTINEIGSTFTIQGFDLNYAGVIIGPSVKYRDGKIVFDYHASKNYLATNKRKDLDGDYTEQNLQHELNVLLKRGVHGLYLFAVDEELQRRLKACSMAMRCGEMRSREVVSKTTYGYDSFI
ncbi:DUF2075 domain-containing protein [Bifidobacterium aerophilum]|uniref:DUF2075 domain-containing protein n=1 Tax=Bifidobacterium aerophilum TaxID=1798155 RepID=A0A6N9Z720_9BIFI|nr:DUF2075 domain-containing protein [Bifidobacterium aerophilum]NEG90507.1 DUF2075 domain-containing protein [Bifidobacterium aerophilum]